MNRALPTLLLLAGALPLLGACSDYFGEGPDPSEAGPCENCPSETGGSGNSGNIGNSGGSGNSSASGGTACASDPLTGLLSVTEWDCPEVTECLQLNCNPHLSACLGPDYTSPTSNFNSGDCSGFASCIWGCNCNQSCTPGCMPDNQCTTCLGDLTACAQTSCSIELENCGSGASAGWATVVTEGVHAADIVMDQQTLYFATRTGLASAPKSGGEAMGLAALQNLRGLALDGDYLYTAQDSGALVRVSTDGQENTTLIPPSYGGGSGAVIIDAAGAYVFYVVGPYLRRAHLDGTGNVLELAMDVAGGDAGGPRVFALAGTLAYYVLQNGRHELRAVDQEGLAVVPNSGMVTTVDGSIQGLVSSADDLYFTELTSDGLDQMLLVKRVSGSPWQTTLLGTSTTPGDSFAPMTGMAGQALATDGTYVYFNGMQGLQRVPALGGEVETIDPRAGPVAIALDADHVYWSEENATSPIKKLVK